jgi:predicted CoA-binding protein
MTEEEKIKQIFSFKNIAVVGMSDNPEKPSNRVPAYLMKQGYKIIPINPTKDEIMGLKSYKSLLDVEDEIDIVDVFRRPEYAVEVVKEAIERKKKRGDIKAIWLQEGIVNDEAKKLAEENGLLFIQDKCMFKEYLRLKGEETKS